ncbi:MAG: carboxypeptidase regulatory-like domain-containing protein [Planctomycetes bacterium]|nr:carboxypeptidase regulatory-like domain-containing protein [Planctomycetota bacterium]
MRPRDLMILGLVLAFAAGVGVVLFAGDTLATEVSPRPEPTAALPDQPVEPVANDAPAIPAATEVLAPLSANTDIREDVDTAGWTKGVVMGDISVAVSVLDQIGSLSVILEELRGPLTAGGTYEPPFKKVVAVERGLGTPTFRIDDVPFSKHPYTISVYAPGLNGGRRTLSIDEHTPLHDNVVLKVTPGRPYSILVRDQDANPFARIDVRLFPVGAPSGRKECVGVTDGYGSVVFENVLAGDYQLYAGQQGMQLCEPKIVTVQSEARVYGDKVQAQGETLVIERGVPLQLTVSNRGGYAIPDANVKLQATDRIQLVVVDAVTDGAGRVEFPHVTPGKWMLTITKQDHQPWTRQITITDGQLPELVDARLTRLR